MSRTMSWISAGLALITINQGLAGTVPLANAAPAATQAFPAAKPISREVLKGVAYLISQQDAGGGWSEGEESQFMRGQGQKNAEVPNVADTSMAVLALLRAGSYPTEGKYASNVRRAVAFICSNVEESGDDSLFITPLRGTRVQQKLGPYIDTFLACQVLSEVKGRMPSPTDNSRVDAALKRCIAKIETNQAANGTWGGDGWAPIHSQSAATAALNRAKQVGMPVKTEVLARAEKHVKRNFDAASGEFRMDGAAGVGLYAAGATLGGLQESINTDRLSRDNVEKIASSKTSSVAEKDWARRELRRMDESEAAQSQALNSVVKKLSDNGFVSGFGCNGGEEFLSYLQISETLIANNRSEWVDWDRKITANLNHVQSEEGSWMGQHCITSRTFCTAAALLVLLSDRSPVAIAARKAKTISVLPVRPD